MKKGSRDQGAEGSRRPLRRATRGARATAGCPLAPSIERARVPFGFTLIEILIVVVVIGILVSALGVVGMKALRGNKVRHTQSIMSNVRIAIDQFAREAPLAAIYNQPGRSTFGTLPPYMLHYPAPVSVVLEDPNSLPEDYVLANRLHRDLADRQGSVNNYVRINEGDIRNHDIRALYAYLRVYSPAIVSQISQSALKPLSTTPEYVNPTGMGPNPGQSNSSWVDVLGIHDAWGVPLDYYLHVKLERSLDPRTGSAAWRVTDRVPVLRSLGIEREEYDNNLAAGTPFDSSRWIFSEAFPSPKASVDRTTGALGVADPNEPNRQNPFGWARALGAGDVQLSEPHVFGFVP